MSPAEPAKRFVIYADFNCPFCYALNELVHAMNLEQQVEWRSIEHAVNASSSLCSFESLSELASEVSEVRRRAPATDIRVPVFRPNSGPASKVVARAARIDPVRAAGLRRAIYRALWVDAVDISDADVLQKLLREHGLGLPDADDAVDAELAQWQSQWDGTESFDRNIPVTLDQSGATMIGLPSQAELETFLQSGVHNAVSEIYAVCAMKPRQRMLVLESDVAVVKMIIEQMRNYQVEVVANCADLGTHIQAHGVPDLLLLDESTAIDGVAADWQTCLEDDVRMGEVPVILMSLDADPGAEVAAFESGVVDYFVKPLHPKVLHARLSQHLDKCNAEKMLVHQARYDSMTGIPNRRAFNLQLQTEWDRGIRSRSQLSILMIDVDHFKAYNDHYGHTQGDDCLAAVGRVLERCMKRPGDFIARYGGEEFVLLLPDTDQRGARHVAQRCCDEIAGAQIPHVVSAVTPHITVSVGTATCLPEQGRSIQYFIDKADTYLYEAKRHGRNRVSG